MVVMADLPRPEYLRGRIEILLRSGEQPGVIQDTLAETDPGLGELSFQKFYAQYIQPVSYKVFGPPTCQYCSRTFSGPGGKGIHEVYCAKNPNRRTTRAKATPKTKKTKGKKIEADLARSEEAVLEGIQVGTPLTVRQLQGRIEELERELGLRPAIPGKIILGWEVILEERYLKMYRIP